MEEKHSLTDMGTDKEREREREREQAEKREIKPEWGCGEKGPRKKEMLSGGRIAQQ